MSSLTKEKKHVLWLTFGLVILSWISLKIVLPALPVLPGAFQCSESGIKLSVSLYLLFFALTQPIWGGMVQKMGSQKTMFIGLFIAATGSLVVLFSNSLTLYIIGRSMEGIGFGAASPIGRTWLTRYFDRKELASFIGIITGAAAAMPAVGPIIGGFLSVHIGWRAIFGFMLLLTVMFILAMRKWLPRENSIAVKDEEGLLRVYFSILTNKLFWGYTLPYAAMLGGLLGYYSAMPYWYHTQLGVSQHLFSFLAVPTVSMYILGLAFVSRMVRKYDVDKLLFFGLILFLIFVIAASIPGILGMKGVFTIVAIMSVAAFAIGLVVPSANAGVLTNFKHVAAPVSAMVGVVIFSFSSLTSYIAMNLQVKDTIWPLVCYLGALSVISTVVGYFWLWRATKKAVRQ